MVLLAHMTIGSSLMSGASATKKKSFITSTPGAVFTTLYFLYDLQMGPEHYFYLKTSLTIVSETFWKE
jgi:hypothetical protein